MDLVGVQKKKRRHMVHILEYFNTLVFELGDGEGKMYWSI